MYCCRKIDTEGHELSVLGGMSDILNKYKPILWIEIIESLDDKISYLKNFSYKLVNHTGQDYFFMTDSKISI
ncbi:MAG: FkbM family methyltransferase [Desulfovibrio sp.]|nr:FkbM family methyltransferase [Desulfovibrio sp.]